MTRGFLIAYAMSAAAYVIENVSGIRNIILFGSVAMGKFDNKSDIDVFIDIPKTSKAKVKGIESCLNNFSKTEVSEKFKLKGLKTELSTIIGDLKSREWENLYASIASEGILLYGKYLSVPSKLKQSVVFSYGPIKNMKKRVFIHRKLFGYSIGGKKYQGFIEKVAGKKLGHSIFSIPIEDASQARKIFEENMIQFKFYEIWSESI